MKVASPYKRFGAIYWHMYDKGSSFTRHVNFLSKWIKEKNAIQISAGDGLIMSKLGISGVDSDPYAYKLARKRGARVKYVTSDSLPYLTNQFDSALISDSLSSYKNLRQALSETRRIISKYLYVAAGIGPKVKNVPGVYSYWSTPQKLVADVVRNGFELVEEPVYKGSLRRYYFKFAKV